MLNFYANVTMEDPQPSTSKAFIHQEPRPSTSKATPKPEPEEVSEIEPEPITKIQKPLNMSPGAVKLRSWLNKSLRITMSDGRILIGIFLCTDRDSNVILGSCSEYLLEDSNLDSTEAAEEPRMLGLVMVPGKHVVNISVNMSDDSVKCWSSPLQQEENSDDII